MLGVTLFGIFLTPVFFYVVRGLAGRRTPPPRPAGVNGVPEETAPVLPHGSFPAAPEDGFGHVAAAKQ